MDKYKVAIIGCGRIGALLEEDSLRPKPCTHIGAYKALPNDVKVEAVCDVDFDKAKIVAKKWKVPSCYKDYRRMMELHSFDVVSVATPVETHARITYGVVKQENKPKVLFMEKPLAHNVDAAKEMVKVCRENNVILAVNHTRRWSPAYRSIKQIIDLKVHGDLARVVGYASREKDFSGNVHMFDLLNYLTSNNRNLQTYVDCPTNYLIFELQVILSDGKIQALHNGRQVIVYERKPSLHYSGINELVASETLQPFSFSEAMKNAVHNVVNCVKEKEKPYCNGNDGLEALRSYLFWRDSNV